jgi:ribosome biogenesis protein UTP30
MAAAAASSSKKRKAKKQATDSTKSTVQQQEQQQHVDKTLAQKAVLALLQYHEKQQQQSNKSGNKEQLLGNNRPIHIQFGLEQAPKEPKLKPLRISIPHPIHRGVVSRDNNNNQDDEDGLEDPEICLIVKDSAQEWVQDLVLELNIQTVKKVVTLTDLRKQYSRYNQRRDLLSMYNVFMADDRILPMLTTALGKDFVKAKKLPLPLRLSKTTLPFSITNNLSATFMTLGAGTSVSVR